ncbi:methionyl-tRNA formyltransferase-like protein [Mesorhizobium sp. M00.F.Ca.ET.151.01.1.1]|nr:methionyl-tRNA formyltransferase-like protein [Mesorhizobium sp. M00.F.Ca.ET.151.01.1.1]
MMELDDLLAEATASVEEMYFRLPVDGGEPIFRERVYCYELYHQLRVRWPKDCPYALNGEVDKRAHPRLRPLGAEFNMPDLLVHTPGDMHGNYAIIEVKPGNAARAGIEKDIGTLSRFLNDVGYERAIYLLYGRLPLAAIVEFASKTPHNKPIEVWVHEQPRGTAHFVRAV